MENALDALWIAFAVLIFVMALTISIFMFSQVNDVSRIVISSTDTTNYYQYSLADQNSRFREVGLETIIPTLYKYYKEQFSIVFLDGTGTEVKPLYLYRSNIPNNIWGQGTAEGEENKYIERYTIDSDNYSLEDGEVFFFDLNSESEIRHEPFTTPEANKEFIACFLSGKRYVYDNGQSGHNSYYDFEGSGDGLKITNGGFIKYAQKQFENGNIFKEMLGEYNYKTRDGRVTQKKRVIVYKLEKKD